MLQKTTTRQLWPASKRAELIEMVENGLPAMIELPERLMEPIADLPRDILRRVRIFALLLFRLPAFNGKFLPALKIVLQMEKDGLLTPQSVVIAASSGNTAVNLALLLLNLFGIARFIAVVKASTPQGKINQLLEAGAEIMSPTNGMTPIQFAHHLAQEKGYVEVNQYSDWGSVHAHKWTANHIAREANRLNFTPSMFIAPLGTTATAVGARIHLEPKFPGMKIVGVVAPLEPESQGVPGSRNLKELEETKFDYQNKVDIILPIGKTEAREYMSLLFRELVPAGMSSGQVLAGFHQLLRDHHREGTIHTLYNAEGQIVPVMPFVDAALLYW